MKAYTKICMIMIVCFGILVGCNGTKEEAINQSKKMAETTFEEKKKDTTENTKGMSYYLPEGFKVENEMENNVILKKGKQEYILFANPHESSDSEVSYNELKKVKDSNNLNSFQKKGRFGYISISPSDDKKYELIIGIGGVKMTTLTKQNDMVENTKSMMEIVNSVEYNQKEEK